MPYDSREVSNLVPVNRKSLEGSVANFSNSYNSGENSVGETGNYRRGLIHKLKMLGAGMMSLIAVACAELNEMDFLGAAMQMGAATNPNLSYKQRVGADMVGGLMRESGGREHYENSARENSGNIITIPKYKNGDMYIVPGGFQKWIRVGENLWINTIVESGEIIKRRDGSVITLSDYEITRGSVISGLPIIREK